MAIQFLALLLLNVVLFVASALLLPKPKLNGVSPNIVDKPTTKEATLPVVWGTMLLPANVTTFTNVKAEEQTEKVTTGLFSSHRVTTGYTYSAIMQVVLCHGPVDELLDIVWQDFFGMNDVQPKTVSQNVAGKFTPVTTMEDLVQPSLPLLRTLESTPDLGTPLLASAPEMFGGYKHGGGVEGFLRFYWGTAAQVKDATLQQAYVGLPNYPAYRGVCHVVMGLVNFDLTLHNFVFGEFGTVPNLAFLVRRCPSGLGLGAGITNIDGSANPAECIFEVLTNTVWGQCVPVGEIDTASFIAVANTLAAESFGINMALISEQQGDEIINELLRYIDGQLFQDPVTGLLRLTLNRADYVLANLVSLDDNNSTSTLTRPMWTQLINQVKVLWTQKQGVKFKQVPTQPIDDIAAQRDSGIIHSLTVPFPAVRDPVLANRLGIRSLKIGATPLQRASIVTNRIAAPLRIGAAFKLTNAIAGINAHVFRVVSIDFGSRVDGKIAIEAVEDIFNLESPLYNTPIDPPTAWTGVGPTGPVRVSPIATSDETTGYLELVVEGGNGLITAVEFSEQSGTAVATAWHVNLTTDRYATQVDLDEKHPSVINWRIRGNLKDGTIGNLADGEINYPVATKPARPVLSYIVHFTQFADLVIDFDQDATGYKYKISYDHIPDETEVAAETLVALAPGVRRAVIANAADLTGAIARVAYASVLAIDDIGNESPITSITMNAINESQYTTPTPTIGPVEAEDSSRNGVFMGQIHIRLTFEINTAEIEVYATGRPGDVPSTGQMPVRTNNQLAGTYRRQEGVIASADTWETEAVLSTNKGYRRSIAIHSIGPTGLRGEPVVLEALCEDVGAGPSATPVNLIVTMSTVAGKARASLEWDNNGDEISDTRVWRSGVVIVPRHPAGAVTLIDDGLTPGLEYQYLIQHIRNGQTTDFAGGVGVVTGSPTLLTPSFVDATPVAAGYDSPYDIPPPNGLVRIRVSNPDPLAYTRVYCNNASTDTGAFTSVAYMNPGDIEVIINAIDVPGVPTDLTRWFYLVAERPLYVNSPDSAHASGNFGS